MARKKEKGKEVHNVFIPKVNFLTNEYFEEAIEKEVEYLKKAWWLYTNGVIGEVKVFRNKIGARVIAYDLPQQYN